MKNALNAAFPSAVLVAVALTQMVRAHQIDQSPWKGGGFGMFATVDAPGARILRCRVLTATGEEAADLPDRLARRAAITRVAPSEANLRILAEELLLLRAVRRKSPLRTEMGATRTEEARSAAIRFVGPEIPLPEGYEEVRVSAVNLELWRLDFDGGSLRIGATRERGVTVERRIP